MKISITGSRDLLFTHVFLFTHFFLQAIVFNSQDSYILCYLNSKGHALFICIQLRWLHFMSSMKLRQCFKLLHYSSCIILISVFSVYCHFLQGQNRHKFKVIKGVLISIIFLLSKTEWIILDEYQ